MGIRILVFFFIFPHSHWVRFFFDTGCYFKGKPSLDIQVANFLFDFDLYVFTACSSPNSLICIQNFGSNKCAQCPNNDFTQLKIRRPWVYKLIGRQGGKQKKYQHKKIVYCLDIQAKENLTSFMHFLIKSNNLAANEHRITI